MLRRKSNGNVSEGGAHPKQAGRNIAPRPALRPPPSLVLVLLLPAAISGVVILVILSRARKNSSNILGGEQPSMHWQRMHGSKSSHGGQPAGQQVNTAGIVSLNLFGAKLLQEVTKEIPENVFISPVSVAALCGMALSGTHAGSDVAGEFKSVLGSDARALGKILDDIQSCKDQNVDISLANSVWVAGSIREEYLKEVRETFHSDAYPLPLSAGPINQWVSKATNGLISEIIEDVDPTDVALLVNAVFFKGSWKESFNVEETIAHPFEHPTLGEISVDMMMHRGVTRKYGTVSISKGTLRLLEIPYGSTGRYAAVIVLPSQGARVSDAVEELHDWGMWIESMSSRRMASVGLPRFRLSFVTKSMKGAFQAMGLQTPWRSALPDEASHFPLLSDDQTIYISDVVHRAVVEVNEKGTVAAAAGAMKLSTRSASGPPQLRMIVDEPFLFAIRDIETGLVLFLGKVDHPKFA